MTTETFEELAEQAEPHIDDLESSCAVLASLIENYAIAEPGVTTKHIDDKLKEVKAAARELNKIAKRKRKLMGE